MVLTLNLHVCMQSAVMSPTLDRTGVVAPHKTELKRAFRTTGVGLRAREDVGLRGRMQFSAALRPAGSAAHPSRQVRFYVTTHAPPSAQATAREVCFGLVLCVVCQHCCSAPSELLLLVRSLMWTRCLFGASPNMRVGQIT